MPHSLGTNWWLLLLPPVECELELEHGTGSHQYRRHRHRGSKFADTKRLLGWSVVLLVLINCISSFI